MFSKITSISNGSTLLVQIFLARMYIWTTLPHSNQALLHVHQIKFSTRDLASSTFYSTHSNL